MDLFLVRHAVAQPRDAGWTDEARPLTPDGAAKMKRAVVGLGKLRVGFDLVLHSPWKRAVQTAKLMMPLGSGRTATDWLAMAPTLELLAEAAEAPRVALVGHEPWMGELCAWLVTGDMALGPQFLFKKGGVAHLEGRCEPSGCRLRAFWTPRTLRSAG